MGAAKTSVLQFFKPKGTRSYNTAKLAKVRSRKRAVGKGKIAQVVKQVLARGQETKYVAETIIQASVVGQASATPGGFFRLIPNLGQGTQDNQRIGDKVSPTRLVNRFVFNWPSDLQNNQDIVVNLWIVRVKGAASQTAVAGILPGQFLKVGNGNNADPTDANQLNMLQVVSTYPLNTDQYTKLRHYRFRMRRGIGLPTNTNTGGEVAPTGVPRTDMFKTITYSCKAPHLKYSSTGFTTPSNFYPVALVYATNADGSAYGDTLRMSINSQLYFKDA